MDKHTPGPWHVGPYNDPIAGIREAEGVYSFGRKLPIIHSASGATLAEADANTRLIAAAPDMLAALEALVGSLAEQDDEGLIEHAEQMRAARAAIAKARGDEETARLRLIRDCHDTSDVII